MSITGTVAVFINLVAIIALLYFTGEVTAARMMFFYFLGFLSVSAFLALVVGVVD